MKTQNDYEDWFSDQLKIEYRRSTIIAIVLIVAIAGLMYAVWPI